MNLQFNHSRVAPQPEEEIKSSTIDSFNQYFAGIHTESLEVTAKNDEERISQIIEKLGKVDTNYSSKYVKAKRDENKDDNSNPKDTSIQNRLFELQK